MTETQPIAYEEHIADVLTGLVGVNETMLAHGLDRTIHHLVQLRASQLNRCAFCVKMHLREARADGETTERLDRVVVWDHVSDFTEAEQAALAWTEALTLMEPKTDYGALRARLRSHFSDAEIAVLTSAVAMINMWNRVNVSKH